MIVSSRNVLFAGLLLTLFGTAYAVRAEQADGEKKPDAGMRPPGLPEDVDLAEAAQKATRLKGTLKLLEKPDPKHPEIVGTLNVDDVSYQLCVADPEIRTRLAKLNNTVVTLMGLYTNKGTTFACASLVVNPGGGPQPGRGKRGGL